MQTRCTRVEISTGGEKVAFIPDQMAVNLDLHPMDRVEIINVKDVAKKHTATVQFYSPMTNRVGLCRELADEMGIHEEGFIVLKPIEKPGSVDHIIGRMNGSEMSGEQIKEIVGDIVNDSLSEVELSCFVTSCTMQDLSMAELYNMTRYLAESGDVMDWGDEPVADKHCTGGVPGNRTSPIVVSIVSSFGVKIPKASSRAITSPAGTADVMETMAKVAFKKEEIRSIVDKAGACLIWGGGLNIAPADSSLIKIRKPISSNPEGLLISSILSKKKAMGSKYVLIDMPVGMETRYHSLGEVRHMAQKLKKVAARLGIRANVEITFGDEPIGNGIGPGLEARDVLKVLRNDPDGPRDLKEKGLWIAGKLLDLVGPDLFGSDHRSGDGHDMAKEALASGKAYSKFKEIISAQGGDPDVSPDDFEISPHIIEIRANKDGQLVDYDNPTIAKVARLAGAPRNITAGIDLYKVNGDMVSKGELLMNVHMGSEEKKSMIYEFLSRNKIYTIE